MPGIAIRYSFVQFTETEKSKVSHCYNCLIPCNPTDTPYCISQALINAVKGDIDNGLIFCGENASKIDKIVSVETLMNELEKDLLEA